MVNYEPKLHAMRVQKRDPIVSQEISWDFGPNFGDNASMRVSRVGDRVTISGRNSGEDQTHPIERARALHEALGNVLRWEPEVESAEAKIAQALEALGDPGGKGGWSGNVPNELRRILTEGSE